MKSSCTAPMIFFLLLFILAVPPKIMWAQENKKEKESAAAAATENMLQSRSFIFRAQSASPMGGKLIQLTYGYFLRQSGDTVVSHLPYYGESHAPTFGTESKGIEFTSVLTDSKIESRKKGGWDVTIIPKDYPEVEKVFLTVFENGKTTLQVMSKSRSPISFSGFVEADNGKR